MTAKSVLLPPQGLRSRAHDPTFPLSTPLSPPPTADTHAWTQAVGRINTLCSK